MKLLNLVTLLVSISMVVCAPIEAQGSDSLKVFKRRDLGGLGGFAGGGGDKKEGSGVLDILGMIEDLISGLHINKTIGDVLKQAEMAAPKDIGNQVRDLWEMPKSVDPIESKRTASISSGLN